MYYGKPIVVTLLPGDVISLRLHRNRRETLWGLHELFFQGVKRDVLREKAEKRKAKKRFQKKNP